MSTDATVGDVIKLWLPGESPWGVVIGKTEDGRLLARIENDLVAIGHGYKYGDIATFERETTPDYSIWKLCPLDRQLKVGPSALPPAHHQATKDTEASQSK